MSIDVESVPVGEMRAFTLAALETWQLGVWLASAEWLDGGAAGSTYSWRFSTSPANDS